MNSIIYIAPTKLYSNFDLESIETEVGSLKGLMKIPPDLNNLSNLLIEARFNL